MKKREFDAKTAKIERDINKALQNIYKANQAGNDQAVRRFGQQEDILRKQLRAHLARGYDE